MVEFGFTVNHQVHMKGKVDRGVHPAVSNHKGVHGVVGFSLGSDEEEEEPGGSALEETLTEEEDEEEGSEVSLNDRFEPEEYYNISNVAEPDETGTSYYQPGSQSDEEEYDLEHDSSCGCSLCTDSEEFLRPEEEKEENIRLISEDDYPVRLDTNITPMLYSYASPAGQQQ